MLGRADATTIIITIGVITTTKQADFQAELGLAAGQPGWVSRPFSWAESTAVRRLLTPSLV